MNHSQAAKAILSAIGGLENIISADHCATRMRFVLKNDRLARDDTIRALEGVLDIVRSGGQYQIVVGPDVVRLYNAMLAVEGFEALAKGGDALPSTAEAAVLPPEREKPSLQSFLRSAASTLAALFVPIIPALTAAGLLQGLILLLSALGVMSSSGDSYRLLLCVSQAPFYYLPFLLAYTSARRFKVDVSMALLMAGVLMSPSMSQLLLDSDVNHFLGRIPIFTIDYSGTVLPIILIVWLMSYVSRLAEKYSPESVKFFSVPLLIILLGGIPGWLFLAPLGNLAGNGLTFIILAMDHYLPWLAPALIGAFNPLMVMSGTHYPLVALGISNLSAMGSDSIVGPGMLASNLAQGAAALAAAAVTRSRAARKQSVGVGITALLGITEPALFGCNLRLRYPLWGAFIGGGAGGLFMGLCRVRRFTYGSPGLLVLPGYLSGDGGSNFTLACIGCAISVVIAFFATIILARMRELLSLRALKGRRPICSPMSGQVMALRHVPDDVFSDGLLGPGCAIMPDDGHVYAPFDCTVRSVARTGHAIGLMQEDGTELLIHVGINTVYLSENCFHPLVQPDQKVHKGEPLLDFDLQAILDSGCSPVTPIVFPEMEGTPYVLSEGFMVTPSHILFGV